jgi:GNAT superfamily N-acetyltransferase
MKQNIKIRKFRYDDWRQIIWLWNHTLPADPITENIFHKWLLTDPNFDPEGFRILEAEGEIKAAAIGWNQVANGLLDNSIGENRDKGFLFPLLIEDTDQGRAYGQALLEDLDYYFKISGKRMICVKGLMALFPDGADVTMSSVYIDNGFRITGKLFSMRADIYKFSMDNQLRNHMLALQQEGFSFVPYYPDDTSEIIDFFKRENNLFRFEFQKKLQWGAPHDEFLFVKKGKEVVGFCQHNHYGMQPERVGPFMVAKSMQGRKIGQIMVARFLEILSHKGFRNVYFNTSEEKYVGFYARNGFKTFREKYTLQKEIK